MKYKNVFFDFGDTLVYLHPKKEQVFSSIIRKNGFKKNLSEIRCAFLLHDDIKQSAIKLNNKVAKRKFLLDYNKKILTNLGLGNNLDSLAIEINNEFKKAHWKLFFDTKAVLEKLRKRGFRLAILANWEKTLHDICKKLDIDHYFKLILASADIGIEKPNPEFFKFALSRLKMDPEETMHIGDDYKLDVIGARGAKIKPVLIDRHGFYTGKDVVAIKTLNQISKILK